MSEQQTRITREELFARIWKTPFVQLGKELGFTYVELVRVCERLNIPRPTGGYWYRLAHGGTSEQPPLPAVGPEIPNEIELPIRSPEPLAMGSKDLNEDEKRSRDPQKVSNSIDINEMEKTVVEKDQPGKLSKKKSGNAVERKIEEWPDRVELTREQLYEKIWQFPCRLLASSFGISDVALKKTCTRMGIPTPPLGYWAKLDAGQNPVKNSLPDASPEQERTIVFHVAENKLRRDQEASFKPATEQEKPSTHIQLLTNLGQIHPLAKRHQQAIGKQKPDVNGMIRIQGANLFQISITEAVAGKVTSALHALFTELNQKGFTFKPSQESFGGLQVMNGIDSLTLSCTELIEDIEREPTDEDKRKPSWEWQLKSRRPTGRLSFEIISTPSLRGRRTWTETEKLSLEHVLATVCEKIGETFQRYEHERQMEIVRAEQREEQQRRWEEERKKEEERQRLKAHQDRLREVAEGRRDVLIEAAIQWSVSCQVKLFVDACEARWKKESGGNLSDEQTKWLMWARQSIEEVSPFNKGYPNPNSDGAFDSTSVPLGGPYPHVRKFKKSKEQRDPTQNIYYSPPTPEPFPYWHLHRRG